MARMCRAVLRMWLAATGMLRVRHRATMPLAMTPAIARPAVMKQAGMKPAGTKPAGTIPAGGIPARRAVQAVTATMPGKQWGDAIPGWAARRS